MLIKFNCHVCNNTSIVNVWRKINETVTKEYYICPCHTCSFDNVVVIYKPLQLQLFPSVKGEQKHDQ